MDLLYYSYEDLVKAYDENHSKENLDALVEWFERYGSEYWSGEYYEIDSSRRLYPIYNWDEHTQEEIDDGLAPDGWEIRP